MEVLRSFARMRAQKTRSQRFPITFTNYQLFFKYQRSIELIPNYIGGMLTNDAEEVYEEDDYLTDRETKRRRLGVFNTGDGNAAEASPTRPSLREKPKTEQENPKAKPKHRIHVPKNPQIPKDSFFTQPPQTSSPYRINDFCWQKPPKLHSPNSKPTGHTNAASKRAIQVFRSDSEEENRPSGSLKLFNEIAEAPHRTHSLSRQDRGHSAALSSQSDLSDALVQNYEDVLADLPSDAFSSPSVSPKNSRISPMLNSFGQQRQDLSASSTNLRQTTLFGTQAKEAPSQAGPASKHKWPLANREEPPTHHELDRDALTTWVYPTNLGAIRDYQYSIVALGLYHNLLVALPTGLGKTFIAATIMLNWFRWTREAKIVFVAPTKPLVSQQVKACFGIAGIPPSATTMLTGGTPPGVRAEEWSTKRVFFMTPQTIINDLKTGICDPKKIVLLVVDEAHRATGGYAYVEVVKFLTRFNSSFRVLALTATPGASIEAVQEVIDSLSISRVEIRTEESLDIRHYVHSRKVETALFDDSEEMIMIMDLFSKSLQPVLNKVNIMNAYWSKDPMSLTPYGCTQARMKWLASNAGKNADWGIKGMVNAIFSLLASLAHGIELLKYHGIGPFHRSVRSFRDGGSEQSEKGGKYRKEIIESIHFKTMMTRIQIWDDEPDFVGHPKLEYLQSIILRHFVEAGDAYGEDNVLSKGTRVMIFAHYRDSAEEIAKVLKRNDPMIRPHVFVGQANSKGSDGMDQKTQLSVIKMFQEGTYNTLVATSIGEEGLDIGEVDLIVCYDASASPIRMLQRMGRTGRKRAGNIVVLLMKGKEETNFTKAKDNYEKMQKEIAAGTKFSYHEVLSRRIVPKEILPVVDKRVVEIPLESSQAGLPEPKKRARPPKKPAKKFNMPDNVRAGFIKASLVQDDEASDNAGRINAPALRKRSESPEPVPSLEDVLLTAREQDEFGRFYLNVGGDESQTVDVPRLDAFPNLQRSFRPTKHLRHGRATTRFVRTLRSIHAESGKVNNYYESRLGPEDREEVLAQLSERFPKGRHGDLVSDLTGSQVSPSGSNSLIARLPIQPRNVSSSCVSGKPGALNEHDDDFMDCIKDETHERNVEPSRAVSPHQIARRIGTSYHPVSKSDSVEVESEEDLPDFKTLVHRSDFTPSGTSVGVTARECRSGQSRRRGKRPVIEDDSDDELFL